MTDPVAVPPVADDRQYFWFFAMSEDAEYYHRAKSRERAIAEGMKEAIEDGYDSFWICEAAYCRLRDDIFDAATVCDQFEEFNEMAWGEDGPDAVISAEASAELEQTLNDAFAAWRAKHSPWTARMLDDDRNGEKIEVTV